MFPTPVPTNLITKHIMRKHNFIIKINTLYIWSDVSHIFIYLLYKYHVYLLDTDKSDCKLITEVEIYMCSTSHRKIGLP